MPIENERKYLLPPDFDCSQLKGWSRHDIRQGYLDDGPRIREIDGEHLFTYKKWIPQAAELVEIEVGVPKEDFDLLWSQRVAMVEKTRYEKRIGEALWVVDLLRGPNGDVFVVLAEAELPRQRLAPDSIPAEIAAHV